MSEIVNTATIKVVVDGEGVDAGLRSVENSAAKTGKTLETLGATAKTTTKEMEELGRAPGLGGMGDGATVAAGKMDRATKSMADAIQRATSAMSSGAKGSVEYYTALANSRGINVAALRPYLEQLDEVTQKTALAAEAQRKLDQSTKFLDSLKARTEGIGKSASELAELRAAELGVADAARPMIQRMREAEEAAEGGATKFGRFGDVIGKAQGILLALGAGAALGAFAAAVKGAVDNLAELDDMAQKTGSSVESLSRLQKVATVFSTDMAQVDGALTKLARGMTAVDDEGSKTERALRAIGLSAKDASGKLRDPSELMADVAKKLQNYRDGAGKAALATDLFGKAGADLLPYLNDLAENYDRMEGSSSAAAAAASALQDQMGFAKLRFSELANSVATAALPALNDLAGAFADVLKEQNSLSAGKGAEWADDLAVGLARVVDVAVLLPRIFSAIAGSFKVVAADISVLADASPVNMARKWVQGRNPIEEFKKTLAERNAALEAANQKYDDLWNKPANQFEQALLKRIEERTKGVTAAGATELGNLKYGSGNANGGKDDDGNKTLAERAKLLAELSGVTAGYMADLSNLQALRAAGNVTEERYIELVTELIAKQPGAKKIIDEQKKAAEDEKKVYEDARKTVEQDIAGIMSQVAAQELKVRTYGLLPDAITAVQIAELEAAKQSTVLTEEGVADIQRRIDALTRLRGAQATGQAQEATKKAADDAAAEWKRASASIKQSLTDALLRGFESGKSIGKNLVDTLKNMFSTLVLRPVIQGVLAPVSGGLASMLPSSASASTSGANGAIGLAQTASNLYKTMTTGFSDLGATIGKGITTIGETIGSQSVASAGSSVSGAMSSVAPYLPAVATAVASYYVAKGIAGQYKIEGIGTALNYLGAVGGLANRAFGMGPKVYSDQSTLFGTLAGGESSLLMSTKYTQQGGLLRDDKRGGTRSAVDETLADSLAATYKQLQDSTAGFASVLGLNAEAIKARAQQISIVLGKDQAANEKTIADFFQGVGDELARTLVPNLGAFTKAGESASVALQRLSGDFEATTQAAQLIGKTAVEAFGSTGIASAASRSRLAELAGGGSNLVSGAQSYAQNFLTEQEKLAPVKKALDAAMTSLGLATVQTRDQFKAVVSSLDLTTDAGARQFVSLMQLSDAFAQVHPVTDAAADAAKSLRDQLDELTMTQDQLAAKERARLDASVRGLFDQVQAAKKAREAQDAAKTSLGNFINQMKSFSATAAGLNSSLLLGDKSTLTPEQQYAEARRQFEETRSAAYKGDATAQGNLQSIENAFLEISQRLNGGDSRYSSDLAMVLKTNTDLSQWAVNSVDVAQASLNALTDSSATLSDISATLQVIAQGGQLAPAVTSSSAPATYVAPINYSRMGTLDMSALVAEVKALREEVKGHRAEQKKQFGDLITSNANVTISAAEKVVDGVAEAVTDGAYAAANTTRAIK